ncbi:MAG: RsmD family RNA methyltransferase, partial [Treponemataceae bacterium]|nr:RsmD family RNA methyltransferase [Treponemataceae bacterium]
IKISTILENVALTESEMQVKIQCHFMPVEYFIRRCKSEFDFIFFDPPFPYRFHEQLVAEAARRRILKEGGTILVHRPAERRMPDSIGTLRLADRRVYGRSVVDFYRYAPMNDGAAEPACRHSKSS